MNVTDLQEYYNSLYYKDLQQNTTSATSTTDAEFSVESTDLLTEIQEQETNEVSSMDSYSSSAGQDAYEMFCANYKDIVNAFQQSASVETDDYTVSTADSSIYGGDIAITDKTTGETTFFSSEDLTVQEVEGTDLSYIVSADGESAALVDDELESALSSVMGKSGKALNATTVSAEETEELTVDSSTTEESTVSASEEITEESETSGSGSGGSGETEEEETTTEVITMADGSKYVEITTTEGDSTSTVRISLSAPSTSNNGMDEAEEEDDFAGENHVADVNSIF